MVNPNPSPATRFSADNPGRAKRKGARDRLSAAFLTALADDFDAHGKEVVEKVRKEDPATYLRVMAGILPKELEVSRPLDDVGDAELSELIALVRTGLAAKDDGVTDRPSLVNWGAAVANIPVSMRMAIADHFEMYGAEAMAETLQADPAAFWRLARRIVPPAALSRLTAEALADPGGRAVLQLMAECAAAGIRAGTAAEDKPVRHRPLLTAAKQRRNAWAHDDLEGFAPDGVLQCNTVGPDHWAQRRIKGAT
jgi:hypothetical protein